MSDILKSVLGLAITKARSATANYLSDKDLTDEELRKKIISDIDDIKSSLRGLSRQPLNSSFHFLKEGISRMGTAVRNTSTATPNEQAAITHVAEKFVSGAGASPSQRKQPTVGEALSSSTFEIISQERWADAKESFRKSREQATIALGNTALSIEDKIMACKLRIVSRILEKFLDDPEAAAEDCLLYLQELQDLPAVRETFTVHVNGGFKSLFNKTKRSGIVESVETINKVLFDFVLKFSPQVILRLSHSHYADWPVIMKLTNGRKHHIVLMTWDKWNRLKNRWPGYRFSHNSEVVYSIVDRHPQVVNSTGYIYCNDRHSDEVSVDFGPNDDIYILQRKADADGVNAGVSNLKLLLKYREHRLLRESTEGLPSTRSDTCWVMRVMENKIVLCNCNGKVYVLTLPNTQGRLNIECSISLPEFAHIKQTRCDRRETDVFMCVTNKREVIITSWNGKKLYVCPITEEGKIEPIIQVPLEEYGAKPKVLGLAFDPTHEEDIIVLRRVSTQDSYKGGCDTGVYSFSRNGYLRDFSFLPRKEPSFFCRGFKLYLSTGLLSNPSGIVTIVQYWFERPCRLIVDELDDGGSFEMDCYNLVGNLNFHHTNL